MSEHTEQVFIFQWAKLNEGTIPALRELFSIPNGAFTKTRQHGSKLVKEGLRAGVPDMFLACPVPGFAGLFIELKHKKGTASPAQKRWLGRLNSAGYKAVVCKGKDHAIKTIIGYLSLRYDLKIVAKEGGAIPIEIKGCCERDTK